MLISESGSMFWENVELIFETDGLLSSEDCTLLKLLDANDVLEKAKEQSITLMLYLEKREILEELMRTIIQEYPVAEFSKDQYKLAYMATEIFLCLQPANLIANLLASRIGDDDKDVSAPVPLLDIFIDFFPISGTVNPLSASLVCRCLAHLVSSRPADFIPFLQKHSFLHKLIGHFDASAVTDLLLKMFQVESISAQPAIAWGVDEGLVFKLACYFHRDHSEDYQDMAAQFLDSLYVMFRSHLHNIYQINQDIADATRFMSNNSFGGNDESSKSQDNNCHDDREKLLCKSVEDCLAQLESSELINVLLDAVCCVESGEMSTPGYAPVYAVKVILSILNKRKSESSFPPGQAGPEFGNNWYQELLYPSNRVPSDGSCTNSSDATTAQEMEDPQKKHVRQSCERVFSLILPKLGSLRQAMLQPPCQVYQTIDSANGERFQPFGRNRMAICQLISALVACDSPHEIQARVTREQAAKRKKTADKTAADSGRTSPSSLLFGGAKAASASEQQTAVVSTECKAQLLSGLVTEGLVKTLLELFYQFPHNTFLHETVKHVLDAFFTFAGYEHLAKAESDPLDDVVLQSELSSSTENNKENCPLGQVEKRSDFVHETLEKLGLFPWMLSKWPVLGSNLAGSEVNWAEKANQKPGFFSHLTQIVAMVSGFQQETAACQKKNCAATEEDSMSPANPFAGYLAETDFDQWTSLVEQGLKPVMEVVNNPWDTSGMHGLGSFEDPISAVFTKDILNISGLGKGDSSMSKAMFNFFSGNFAMVNFTNTFDKVATDGAHEEEQEGAADGAVRMNPMAFTHLEDYNMREQREVNMLESDEDEDEDVDLSDKPEPGTSSNDSSSEEDEANSAPMIIRQQRSGQPAVNNSNGSLANSKEEEEAVGSSDSSSKRPEKGDLLDDNANSSYNEAMNCEWTASTAVTNVNSLLSSSEDSSSCSSGSKSAATIGQGEDSESSSSSTLILEESTSSGHCLP